MMVRFVLIIFLMTIYCQNAFAATGHHNSIPTLLTDVTYFHEDSTTPLSFAQAEQHFRSGENQHPPQDFMSFGINKRATWIKLNVQNHTHVEQYRRLNAAQPWVDSLAIYLVNDQGVIQTWHSGDEQVADSHLLPGVGFVFDMKLPPGQSQIFIRGQSLDPLTLPIALLDAYQSRTLDAQIHVTSGILYGILLALVGMNLVLYLSIKQLDALFYSLYISCFIIVNISYNGYGFAWLYSNSLFIENNLTLIMMVFHGVSGLVFVSHFLRIHQHSPKLNLTLLIYSGLGILTMVTLISLNMHLWATKFAFKFLSLTTMLMILLGVLNLNKTKDTLYFLIAVMCSMLGLLITTFSVWGVIPYNYYSYNGAVFGVVFEATILAVIVAYRLKDFEQQRITAEYLSSYDPLMNLFNRRSFMAAGHQCIQQSNRTKKILSFVMMDIDHFKQINDTYGHHIGDLTLSHIAKLLKRHTRENDIIARWGGEEMVILLPDTNAEQALAYTEHLRATIAATPFRDEAQDIQITASFGIATRMNGESLETLYQLADKRLYQAKQQGRNRVEPQDRHLPITTQEQY
ncbi:sensor domain-containing diguanylate cyclase [Vibrio spartinae]|uniref:diguanylate cyclase n=1 Tax=Vibrio spartinae TaxID=1918945 RepID=A0ABX6R5J4_9VIBR|nr:diguanylate cyclase [Vibrio spartinae]QMV16400.1 putative diguanylate cyclase YcdT [Vibrio spartinae]